MKSENYYLSDHWRKKRQQRLDIDDQTCQGCGITSEQLSELGWKPLEVHHKNAGPPDYKYPSMGNEQMSHLLTLCSLCHDGITNSVRSQRYRLDPSKKVELSSINSPSLFIPSTSRKSQNENCQDQNQGRITVDPPQRTSRRSAKFLREGFESREREKEEN